MVEVVTMMIRLLIIKQRILVAAIYRAPTTCQEL